MYAFQTTKLPLGLIQEIEKMSRRFLWGGGNDSIRKLHWCNWKLICQPKEKEGLGIKRLRHMNIAMIAKLGWKFLTEPNSLWVKVLQSKYGCLFDERKRYNTSQIWRHIKSTVPLLKAGLESSNHLDDNLGNTPH